MYKGANTLQKNTCYMITFRNICRTLSAICVLTAVGCVDESYRIDEVSSEVTVAEGTTTLPVGYLNKMSLGDLLQNANIEGLREGADGGYEFCLSGTGEPIAIEGITNEIEIPQIATQVSADYPEFALKEQRKGIDELFSVQTKLSDVSMLEGQSYTVPAGYTVSAHVEESITEVVEYDVPAELSAIKRIYLKPTAEGNNGARIDTRFLLNDINAINGGGTITLELRAPEGFNIYDAEGCKVQGGSYVVSTCNFAADEGVHDFVAYIESVECNGTVNNGKFTMAVDLEYRLSLEMTTKAGSFKLNKEPELEVKADLAYRDADVVLNEVKLLDHEVSSGGNITINDIPKEIISIRELAFDASPITLFASGFDWMDEALAESITIEAWMPEYIVLRDDASMGYSAEEGKLHTTLNALRKGIDVSLEALYFGEEGLQNTTGSLEISFAPDIVARIEQGTELKLSSLQHDGQMTMRAGIKSSKLKIKNVSGWFDYTYDYTAAFNLTGVEDLGLEIKGVGLSPVLELTICNPFSVDIVANLSVVPKFGGQVDMSRALELRDVAIQGKELVDGQVVPTVIVLGTENRRAEYEGSDALFVACDLEKVLRGPLPDAIELALGIATDLNSVSTLYAMDEYEFTYGYNFVLPVELSDKLQVRYEDELYFGGESENPLAMLAELDHVKVGDVAVIAEVATTLPLQLTASADLLDAKGNVLPVKLAFAKGNDAIVGSADGITEAVSTLRLELDIPGDGSIAQLADIAGIRFALDAGGVDKQAASLREEQYVAVSLQLELSGGVSADWERLFNAE